MAKKNTVTVGNLLIHAVRFRIGSAVAEIPGFSSSPLFDKTNGLAPRGTVGRAEIDADLWAQIEKVYAETPLLKKGFVFANKTEAAVDAEGSEKADEKTGLERITTADLKASGVQQIDPKTKQAIS